MACHMFSAKPLSEPVLAYSLLNPWEQIFTKFENQNTKSFFHENAFEIAVFKIAAILFRWVKRASQALCTWFQGPLLLTRFNFNASMDK